MPRVTWTSTLIMCLWAAVYFTQCGRTLGQSQPVKIVLAGDSTVTDEAGWGYGFKSLLTANVQCENMAQGGRSSRSYRAEGHWQRCLDARPDFLLIQFGHNDQPGKGPERESAAEGDFRRHLEAFIDETRGVGITPVLITPLTRRRWTSAGLIEPSLAEYAIATSIVATEKQVILIDLHRLSIRQCEAMGSEACRAMEPMTPQGADHTHLNHQGSLAVAELILSELIQRVPEMASAVDLNRLSAARVPVPNMLDLTAGRLRVKELDATITLSMDRKSILVYNKTSPPLPEGLNPIYRRSGFLHPVFSPSGKAVTATFPSDHAHQHGIFSAWVNTTWNDRAIDFWNLAGGTGRVLHQRVVKAFVADGGLGFEVDLVHRAEQEPVVDVIRERWKITAFAADGLYHGFDLESTQETLTDMPLIINAYHYGGFAVRGPMAWLSASGRQETDNKNQKDLSCVILNDQRTDRVSGNHQQARWVAMSGSIDGQPASIIMMSARDNLRFPQAARLHPQKPYFCFTPCHEAAMVIDRSNTLRSKYRYLITDAAPDANWIDQQWTKWQSGL